MCEDDHSGGNPQCNLIGREKPLCGFGCALQDKKRSAPSCKHGSHPFSNPAPCLPQVLASPPSQLAVGNCMHSEWHLDIEKPLFHLYKNPVQCGKQRTPVSPESQPQYCKCARDGTAFCHNLSDAVRQRFAAYYPGRKTQRERSATTGSAGVMRMLGCCSLPQKKTSWRIKRCRCDYS